MFRSSCIPGPKPVMASDPDEFPLPPEPAAVETPDPPVEPAEVPEAPAEVAEESADAGPDVEVVPDPEEAELAKLIGVVSASLEVSPKTMSQVVPAACWAGVGGHGYLAASEDAG